MKEFLQTGCPPESFPDPRKSSPEEFASACIIVFREEGKKMIGHGVFIEQIRDTGGPAGRLRLELDRDHGQVVRIFRESDQNEIPLATQMGGRIIEESKETKLWTESNGRSPRFQRVEQPATV